MKKSNKISAIACLTAIMLASTAFAACSAESFVNPGDKLGGGGTVSSTPTTESDDDAITSDDTSDLSDLENDTSSDDAKEVVATDSAITITEDGDYTITGEVASVTLDGKLDVHLFLNNATIVNGSGAAISCDKKCTVTITCVEGTTNTVKSTYSGTEDTYNAIHIKGDLSINGKGTLNVSSETKSAIKATKSLSVASATINASTSAEANCITAANIAAKSATINVTAAGKDGMHAECNIDNNDGKTYTYDEAKEDSGGFVELKDTTYSCSKVYGDGIQADTYVYIEGGTTNISTTGTYVAYSSANMSTYSLTSDDFRYKKSGNTYTKVDSDTSSVSSLYALTQSCKGIKVGEISYNTNEDTDDEDDQTITEGDYIIQIVSGTFNINTADDCIHTNVGNAVISGGTFTLNTGDDGITCDNLLKMTGGTVTIESCYEGLEGAYVEISGGTADITASDDGINAASDDTSITEHIIISGGTVTVNAEGDGIDSNGSILIEGGTVTVHGPTNGGNAGLDADGGILVNGGTVFACSAIGMVETPATNSTQYVLSYAQSSNISAGTVLTITDSSDNVLYTVTTVKSCQSLIISLADFESGSTYYVYGGSTKLASFTISSIITSVGSSTTPGSGGFTGGGNNGGGNGGMGGGGNRR